MFESVGKILKSVSGVKMRSGMFGNVCTVIIVLIITLGILAALTKDRWIIGGTIVLIVIACTYLLSKMIRFAEKNPSAAVLESLHYYKREELILQASKGRGVFIAATETLSTEPAIGYEGQHQGTLPLPSGLEGSEGE
jgi:hypothetical protein